MTSGKVTLELVGEGEKQLSSWNYRGVEISREHGCMTSPAGQ